jgi:hypothetical protein
LRKDQSSYSKNSHSPDKTGSPGNVTTGSPESRNGYEGGVDGIEKWFNKNYNDLGVIQEVSIRTDLNE